MDKRTNYWPELVLGRKYIDRQFIAGLKILQGNSMSTVMKKSLWLNTSWEGLVTTLLPHADSLKKTIEL